MPREVLARLLDLASCAPSGGNSQPVEWLVIHNMAVMRRLAPIMLDWLCQQPMPPAYHANFVLAQEQGLDVVCRGAPHMVIAHTTPGGQANGVIALTYLELAAYSLGLGACWGGFPDWAISGSPEIRAAVGLPADRVINGVLMLGYPRYAYHRAPPRNPARVEWV